MLRCTDSPSTTAILNVSLTAPYLFPPPAHGNHAGVLLAEKPLHGIPKVLLITTQSQPTHLTCGRTKNRCTCSLPRSWRMRRPTPLFGQNGSLQLCLCLCPPMVKQRIRHCHPGAFPDVASLERAQCSRMAMYSYCQGSFCRQSRQGYFQRWRDPQCLPHQDFCG